MAKIAVIDIGSNSVRLMVMSNGKTLYKRIKTTRLGEGICSSASLSREAIARTAAAVGELYFLAEAEGCAPICAFATAAVRGADNAAEFLSAVKGVCPLTVDVLSGEEEAAMGLAGAIGSGDGGILDVGGGSSELTFRVNGKTEYARSINIGAVRLFDGYGRNKEALLKEINRVIPSFGDVKISVPLYGIGGTATSLAAVSLGLKEYSPEAVDGTYLSPDELVSLADKLLGMSVDDILKNYCLPPKRAEIVGGGALLISEIVKRVGAGGITVSERDNLEGYAVSRGLV